MKETNGKTISKKPRKNNGSVAGDKTKASIKKNSATSFKLAEVSDLALRTIKYIIIFFILIFIIYSALLINYSATSIDKSNVNVIVEIPTGSSFIKVTKILDDAGLIKSRTLFSTLATIKRATRVIRAGEYEFNTSLTPGAIIDKLIRGEIKNYVVTIPEDFSVKDIAERLEFYKLVHQETFFELARDKSFLMSLGVTADSIEGYLFPETYLFNRSMSTRQIMKIMVSQFWKKVTPEMVEKASKFGFDTHQFITFASIVGKESGYDAEKPFISAVFHNRLRKKMRLQSDPTAVYDLEKFDGRVLRSHLKRNSPYNTYIINGLPPGPIANPGMTSLMAALNPAPVKYIYFVSKNDGTHYFSDSLKMHNEAIKQYRLNKTANKGK